MTGALWAAASGVGFGIFQSLNRRAVAQMDVQLRHRAAVETLENAEADARGGGAERARHSRGACAPVTAVEPPLRETCPPR